MKMPELIGVSFSDFIVKRNHNKTDLQIAGQFFNAKEKICGESGI
jgi:hypothetical protein